MSDREEVSTSAEEYPAGKPLARKVMIALTVALAPIGFLAAFLSILGYAEGRQESIDMIEARAEAIAEEINEVATSDALLLRTLAFRFADPSEREECFESLERIVGVRPLFSGLIVARSSGEVLCDYSDTDRPSAPLSGRASTIFSEDPDTRTIVFFTDVQDSLVYAVRIPEADGSQGISVLAVIPLDEMRRRLRTVARPVDSELSVQISRADDAGEDGAQRVGSEGDAYTVLTPTQIGGLQVRYGEVLSSFPPRRIATIVIPPLMWLAALVIAWLTLRRLVLRPLMTMRLGLEERSAQNEAPPLAPRVGNSSEFLTFATAFDNLSAKQRRDRGSLEDALAAQQRLVREVHHRVKNNLQIITSLLSIKARDAKLEAERKAYGVIQLRVEALALVHRWLYADDASRGVDVAALLNDLLANVETSLLAVVDVDARFTHRLERAFIGQDIAVPLAFTITELLAAEAGRLPPGSEMVGEVTLKVIGEDCEVRLVSSCFTGLNAGADGTASASDRIIQGMARQLRGTLTFDAESQTYLLSFPGRKKTVEG